MVMIEPRGDIVRKYKVCAANGMAEVLQENPFNILLSKYGTKERKFRKVMAFL